MSSASPPFDFPRLFPTGHTDEREPNPPNPPTDHRPPKKTRPLAASPQPADFYWQYKCAICHAPIAQADGADFIGHAPCLHRGTCPRSSCIRAYYGGSRQWALPYERGSSSSKPLFCQAAGCGGRIEAWCYVKAVASPRRGRVVALPQGDPKVEKAERKARMREWEREREVKERGERRERKEKEKREKENRRPLIEDRVDFFLGTALLCGAVCCCSPLICFRGVLDQ
ncbi:predicted protein [Chaetomium globosum CBS 148.51]|uniref:Uncharacterized protein n=1 Tax=Chaetomium globosum (strain ATCC 6205 / CBS 148.51 / DSM 1962 / NBRC 6347 / NRRL 1970) TaxID=306901 RepID=Q2GZF7_CHAGB|nr:uncharacterized protein CHGG_05089 [Chaetomium globosum CBS 148.51]EAQ88470.1 predicted protein [Chaetomium globosum CBS 148.51]